MVRKITSSHRVSRYLIVLLLIVGGLLSYHYAKGVIERHQVRRQVETALNRAHFNGREARSSIIKEAAGPFSGIVWYDYTFSNQATLAASQQYHATTKSAKQVDDLETCPIVYRVIVRPPTRRVRQWSGEVYLDTNQHLSASGRSNAIQALNAASVRQLDFSATKV